MGTAFHIVLYARDETRANSGAEAAFARVDQLNGLLSDYEPTSELNELCRRAGSGRGMAVGPDLWNVLLRAREFSALSEGAFDVTVGPLVRLWRQARRTGRMPPAAELEEARALVDYRKLLLDPKERTAMLLTPGMQLDLGGIAKGYAAAEALAVLKRHGIPRSLVAAAGDIAVGQAPPRRAGWRIDLRPLGQRIFSLPGSEAGAGPPILILTDGGVSTSGDVFQYVVIDGVRYSHIVDPRTGLGLQNQVGVSVTALDPTTADALATTVSILGVEKGLALIEKIPGAAGIIAREKDDGTVEIFTSKRTAQWRFHK